LFGRIASSQLRREHAFVDQRFAKVNARRQIDFEHFDCGAADCGPADKERAVPKKMSCPFVSARVEKSHNGASIRIDSCDVTGLVPTASKTGKRKVAGSRRTAMFDGDNVVDFVTPRRVRLR
jgi:hypothetical protein